MRKSDNTFLSKAVRLEFSILEGANEVLFLLVTPIQGPEIELGCSLVDVMVSTIGAEQICGHFSHTYLGELLREGTNAYLESRSNQDGAGSSRCHWGEA